MNKKDIKNPNKKLKASELNIGATLPPATSEINKTGSWKDMVPIVDEDKCINCMMCVNSCPENAIKIKKVNRNIKRGKFDYDFCKGCGICANICPVKAITMHTIKESEELLKQKKYTKLENKKKELKKLEKK